MTYRPRNAGILCALAMGAAPSALRAQHAPAAAHPAAEAEAALSASRPGLAESAGTVGARVVQVEGGYSQARLPGETEHAFGEVLVRLGLGARGELRVGLNSFAVVRGHDESVSGLQDARVGAKARLADGHGVLPSAALLLDASLPTGSDAFGSAGWSPATTLSLDWDLPAGLGWTTAASYRRVEAHGEGEGEITLAHAVSRALTHALHAHAELAVVAPAGAPRDGLRHLSAGIGYHLSADTQLDLWAGRAGGHGESETLFGFGIARRWR